MNRREFFGRFAKALGLAALLPFLPREVIEPEDMWPDGTFSDLADTIYNISPTDTPWPAAKRVWWDDVDEKVRIETIPLTEFYKT